MTEKVVVTGVGGYVGNRVAEELLKQLGAEQLIVTSRDPEVLATWTARGADARVANYDEPAALRTAFSGGHRLFLVSSMLVGERRRQQHLNAVSAAGAAGVEHIVYTSYLGAGDPDSAALVSADHRFTEETIRASGMRFQFLRNSQYADAMAEQQGQIAVRTGRSIGNTGAGRIAFVSRDDVAAVATALLLGGGDANTAYDVTGPELLTYRQVGELIAEISGADVEIVDLSDDEMYAMWDAMGVPRDAEDDADAPVPWCSDDMVSFGRTIREGGMSTISDTVERLTGRPAEPLSAVMARFAPGWALS